MGGNAGEIKRYRANFRAVGEIEVAGGPKPAWYNISPTTSFWVAVSALFDANGTWSVNEDYSPNDNQLNVTDTLLPSAANPWAK